MKTSPWRFTQGKQLPFGGYRGWLLLISLIVFTFCVYMIHNDPSPLRAQPSTMGGIPRNTARGHRIMYVKNGTSYEVQENSSTSVPDLAHPALKHDNISYAYSKNWVGFPDLQDVDCLSAFLDPTLNNSVYPEKITRLHPSDFLYDTRDCKAFVDKYGYSRYPAVSKEEREFPLAFALLIHKDLDQLHFLLRAIYRPHNVYCLSVDTKSSIEYLEAAKSIARCLPNVFVTSKLENIVYGGLSRLMADLHCFEDLLRHPVKWKYAINGPGQVFPLKTNLEMVQVLKLLNGTNAIERKTGTARNIDRYLYEWEYVTNDTTGTVKLFRSHKVYHPPPHRLEPVKCSAYGAYTREFVEFVLTSDIAKDLLEWVKPVFSPDELFWATLNYNTIVPAPGGSTGAPQDIPLLSSFSLWENGGGNIPCRGKFVRYVCIFSPADLPMLMKRREFFANKFYLDYHPVALHCLDQLIYNRTFSANIRNFTSV